jgi:hypothetical protein
MLSPTEALRAYNLARYGGASEDACNAARRDLMAAERAAETIDQRCFRLGLEAVEFDRKAEDALAEAAQDDLVVKVRRERFGAGDDTAVNIARRACASRIQAADATAEAERLRSQASALRRAQAYAPDVVASLEAAE